MADKARIGTPQVVTRYVPNDWDESQGTTPQVKVASTGGFRPVQVHVVTYEDGTREEFVLNQNGVEAGKIRDLEPNESIATAYKDKQKATTPTATSQETAKRDTITADGRVKQWNPETNKYDIDVGAAGTAAAATGPAQERAAQEQVERQRNSQSTGIPLTDPERAQWDVARQKEQQATDERGRAEARQQRLDLETSANRIWQQGLQERQLSGQEAERARVAGLQERDQTLQEKQAARQEVKDNERVIDGEIYARQPDGSYKKAARTPDTAVPSVDLTQATMGKYTDALKKQWDEKYVPLINAGTMPMADALKQFGIDQKMAEAKANEEISVLSAQQNIRGQDVTQRGQSLTSVENQRSGLTSAFNQAASMIKPAEAGKYGPEMIADIMRLYGQSQEQAGIPRGVPSQQPYTPQQSQVMGAPGPSPIVFNINTGGAQPQSAPLADMGAQMGIPGGVPETPGAMPPPTSPEQLLDEMKRNTPDQFWTAAVDRVGQDLQRARERAAGGVAPGMSLSGGQLRAPGVSAGAVSAGPVGQVG